MKEPFKKATTSPRPTFPTADAEWSDFKQGGLKALLFPIDIASIVFFRVIFGLILLWETTRYFSNDWIGQYWVRPKHHFTYWPFDFLQPLPGDGMYWLFGLLAILSIMIMIGAYYRIATVLFFVGFTYSFLLEQARYLNHFYLVILIAFLLIFIPANRAFSVDAKQNRALKSSIAPAWCLWVLRFTLGLPYFWGGVAKINPDWLKGEPLRMWLAETTDFPIIGRFFTEEWMVYFMTYSGLLLDLLIIPFLLIKRTRKWAFIIGLLFHLMNSELFSIGIFPWFMLIATAIFFNPSWPRSLYNSINPNSARPVPVLKENFRLTPGFINQKLVLSFLFLWAALHIALPLRHFFIPGDVHWTEEGHKYAWHMKLRSKKGETSFIVKDKNTGEEEIVQPKKYLKSWQIRKMSGWPNMIWQMAQIIKKDYKEKGRDVAVYAQSEASLNGRQFQYLIDPKVDLTTVSRPGFGPVSWIVPLQIPLSQQMKSKTEEERE